MKFDLLRWRIIRNLSQSELARLSGVSQGYLSAIEAGNSIPSIIVAKKIADVLNVRIDQMICEDFGGEKIETIG